jgi:hypothetical protein
MLTIFSQIAGKLQLHYSEHSGDLDTKDFCAARRERQAFPQASRASAGGRPAAEGRPGWLSSAWGRSHRVDDYLTHAISYVTVKRAEAMMW